MIRIVAALVAVFLCPLAFAAPWNQDFAVSATDPNGAQANSHEFRARVDGGAWSAVQSEATPATTFTLNIDHGSVVEVRARPCEDGLCADWASASYTVPAGLLPYSTILITVPAWTKS